jgi:sugar phosphate isomerase/epimerase
MHLSTHNWMRAETLETTLRRIKRLGFTSIEISGEPAQYDVPETRRLLREYGIRCWGAVTLTLGERNLASADEARRARTVAYMQSVVRLAHDLGGSIVTVVPTTVGKLVPDAAPAQEWHWVVEGLREVHALAERLGIRLALEPLNRFETYFLNRGDQALALAQQVGPNCGVCLDAFHLNIEEADMFAAIRAAGDRLADFHVADNNRMAPGQGALDWTRIVATLREAGYDGALTVEFVAPIDRTPANPYPDQLETGPVDITPEQRQFIQDHGSSLLSERFYSGLMATSAQTLLPLIG